MTHPISLMNVPNIIYSKRAYLSDVVFDYRTTSLIIFKNFLGFYLSITAWQEHVAKTNETTLVMDVAKETVQTFSRSDSNGLKLTFREVGFIVHVFLGFN